MDRAINRLHRTGKRKARPSDRPPLVDIPLLAITEEELSYSLGPRAGMKLQRTSSTIGGGRGCNKFVPVLVGNRTEIAHTGDIFDQPPGQMWWIRGEFADHVGEHVVLSPEGSVLVTSPGTKSSYPRPPQSLNSSAGRPYYCWRGDRDSSLRRFPEGTGGGDAPRNFPERSRSNGRGAHHLRRSVVRESGGRGA